MNEIQQVDLFIDDLIQEKKPRAYNQDVVDPEMEKMFESIRAVKRLRKSKTAGRFLSSRWLKGVAAAAALLLVVGLMTFPGGNEMNIVHAVVKAYEELQSYSGVTEIRTERDGKVEFLETIEIQYKKPYKYSAFHSYNGFEIQYLSDGDRLAVIEFNMITLENVFPEKELWRYHIGTAVWELEEAAEVNITGTETLFGREASILEYRFAGDNEFHQMWIDKATNLPLRKVLNHPEGFRLVVEFKELQINPVLDDDLFAWVLPQNVNIRELNRTVTQEEIIKRWPEASVLPGALPEEMELAKAGILENDLYEYVLRFQGSREKDFMDIYYTTTPMEYTLLPETKLGQLAGGYVDYDAKVWNVFERYPGENKVARWVRDDAEVYIISSRDISQLLPILEKLAGEKIEFGAALLKDTLELFFMEITETSFKMAGETRAFSQQPDARRLMEALLKGPEDEDLSSIIPDNTRLLDLRVEGGIAYVDFSNEIAAAHYGGETEEVLIDSIVWTLTQLDEIEAVQLLIEGEVVDTIGGHMSISKPLTR
ncbi:MAG: GerMN domain-containing protein [Bacillota bacterium]|nr:GerMN domain-containing protein [Bacillota bacterium]